MQVLHFFHHDRVVYQLSFLITLYTKSFTFFHHDRVVYQLGRLRPFIHVSFAVSLEGAALSFVLGHKLARDTEVRERGKGGGDGEYGSGGKGGILANRS